MKGIIKYHRNQRLSPTNPTLQLNYTPYRFHSSKQVPVSNSVIYELINSSGFQSQLKNVSSVTILRNSAQIHTGMWESTEKNSRELSMENDEQVVEEMIGWEEGREYRMRGWQLNKMFKSNSKKVGIQSQSCFVNSNEEFYIDRLIEQWRIRKNQRKKYQKPSDKSHMNEYLPTINIESTESLTNVHHHSFTSQKYVENNESLLKPECRREGKEQSISDKSHSLIDHLLQQNFTNFATIPKLKSAQDQMEEPLEQFPLNLAENCIQQIFAGYMQELDEENNYKSSNNVASQALGESSGDIQNAEIETLRIENCGAVQKTVMKAPLYLSHKKVYISQKKMQNFLKGRSKRQK